MNDQPNQISVYRPKGEVQFSWGRVYGVIYVKENDEKRKQREYNFQIIKEHDAFFYAYNLCRDYW